MLDASSWYLGEMDFDNSYKSSFYVRLLIYLLKAMSTNVCPLCFSEIIHFVQIEMSHVSQWSSHSLVGCFGHLG